MESLKKPNVSKQAKHANGKDPSHRTPAKKDAHSTARSSGEQLLYLVLLAVFALIVVLSDGSAVQSGSTGAVALMDGWTDAGGNLLRLEELPLGELALSMDLSGQAPAGRRLCLKSVDTNFQVLSDGEVVYSYRPALSRLMGRSYACTSTPSTSRSRRSGWSSPSSPSSPACPPGWRT